MNCIQCKTCYDILAPVERAGVRTCACGNIQMRAVPVAEIGHNNLVEVKIYSNCGTESDKELKQVFDNYDSFAQVVKIHNHYLKGDHGLHEWLLDEPNERESLFYKNQSQIVITPLDTPGVKVVNEWSNKSLPTTEEYLYKLGLKELWDATDKLCEHPDVYSPEEINIFKNKFNNTDKIWVAFSGIHTLRKYTFLYYNNGEMYHILSAGNKKQLSENQNGWNVLNIFKTISPEMADEWMKKVQWLSL